MPIPSPFHERTRQLCTSFRWKDWAGYYAVCSFESCHEQEYFAYRHAAGLMDATPLFKYDIRGTDSARFLARVVARDIGKLRVGRVTYCCWCDDDGKVMDDGTVTRLDDDHYRLTAAEPTLHWLLINARAYQVDVHDITHDFGILALQGPLSRDVLEHACGDRILGLRFFRTMETTIDGRPVTVSRTGYTGDLGYEIWCKNDDALPVYDALLESGQPYRLLPAGLDALDVARIEAGFIMNGVDYFSANHCLIEARKSTPLELGLEWTVHLDRAPFIGQGALKREHERGPAWAFVGLEYDWPALEALFARYDLPPETPHGAWRTPLPVYDRTGKQIGQATSGAWSPTLKKNLALASVQTSHSTIGRELLIEVTVEFERLKAPVRVTSPLFFDPERKRA